MLNRPLNAVLVRLAIVAAALAALLLIAPAATAQEADADADPPCTMTGSTVACDYDENDDAPVANFTSMDPEQQGIEWELDGVDKGAFDITGGELTFKESPDYESPGDMARAEDNSVDPPITEVTGDDNMYQVTVIAIEDLAEGQDPPAKRNSLDVTVTVMNVEEPGTITLDRLQTRVLATGGVTATLTDPDRDSGGGAPTTTITTAVTWEWSIPKVSRPILDNDDHWTDAGGTTDAVAYSPVAGAADSFLRVKAEYTDGEGAMKEAYARSAHVVVAALAADATNNDPAFDETTVAFEVAEDASVSTVVGTVRGSDDDSADILSHVLTGADAGSFKIDIATGEITVNGMLDHEEGSGNDDGVYTVTVTAYDPSNADGAATVNITANDVNEAPGVALESGVTEDLEVDENHVVVVPDPNPDGLVAIVLGEYDPTDPDDGDDPTGEDAPELTLGGDDAAAFTLSDEGNLRFTSTPDYESPTDANMDSVYKVSIVATDDEGLTGMRDLSIKVMNLNEDGTLEVSPDQPGISVAVDATLTDPDKGISGAKWQWYAMGTKPVLPLTDGGDDGDFIIDELPAGSKIDGATSMSYTPRPEIKDVDTTDEDESYAGDEGMFLIATVLYSDNAPPMDDADTEETDESLVNELVMVSTHAVRKVPDVNNAPVFDSASMTREVNENETTVPDAVQATDPDDDPVEYEITGGADMDAFDIDNDGLISTKGDTELNAEGDQTVYVVVVTATDPFRGSSSTTVTITVMNVNEDPEFEADDPDDYAENGMGEVATFTAADPEMAAVKWSISGLDAADFEIGETTGVLTFAESPDYESPSDRNREAVIAAPNADPPVVGVEAEEPMDNDYLLTVTATEERAEGVVSARSTDQDITVTVTNEEEPGTVTLNRLQIRAGVTTGVTASLSDDDGPPTGETAIDVTWLWSVPKVSRPVLDNDDHWTAAGNTTSDAAEYDPVAADEGAFLRAKAFYTDGEGAMKEAYARMANTVAEVRADADNEDPAFGAQVTLEFEIPESAAVGTVVGTVRGSDDDTADILSHELTATGAADGKFEIDIATGVIRVAAALNHEETGLTDGEYEVTVMVYDPSNASGGENNNVSITATDVNEAPDEPTGTGEVMSINEEHAVADLDDGGANEAEEAELGTFTAIDQDDTDTVDDDTVTLELGGEDAAAFKLTDDTTGGNTAGDGSYELRFASSPNYESPTDANGDNKYKVSIVAKDNEGLTSMTELTIEVINIDEPGMVTLDQRQPAVGRSVTATLTDEDGETSGAMWQWYRTDLPPTDGADDDDVVTAADIAESAKIDGAVSATYTPVESIDAVEDDPATAEDESVAAVQGDEGMFLTATVSYRDPASPKDDDATTDTVDESKAANQHRAETSENAVREQPEDNNRPDFGGPQMREVQEDDGGMPARTAAKGISPAVAATDADGDHLRYTVSGGDDMGAFSVNMDTGQLSAKASTKLDYEGSQRTYMVEVEVTDPFGGSDSTMVTITVTDFNEAPTLGLTPPTPPAPAENVAPMFADDADTAFMVYENMPMGTEVGMVEASDPGDMLTYSDDSDYFDVDGMGNITTTMMLDYEAMASHTVTITATDDEDASDSIDVTVMVDNVEECEDAGATAADTTNAGQMIDCEALLASRDALMGDDATRTLNWSAGTPIAEWYGVRKLTESGRVEWLYLHGVTAKDATDDADARAEVKLNGTIPAELGDLAELTRLYLHRNNLAGEIPAELNGLTNLVWLRIYDNMLSGEVPDLSDMTSLERLYIHQNDLTGGVPTMLSASVTHLLVHRNDLDGEIPDLNSLTNLVWLSVYDNDLSGEIPAELGTLSNLQTLYVHGNDLTGEVPMEIGNLSELTRLWLRDNMLVGELPGSLDSLMNLWSVRIDGNSFTGCVPAALANAANNDVAETGQVTCGDGS